MRDTVRRLGERWFHLVAFKMGSTRPSRLPNAAKRFFNIPVEWNVTVSIDEGRICGCEELKRLRELMQGYNRARNEVRLSIQDLTKKRGCLQRGVERMQCAQKEFDKLVAANTRVNVPPSSSTLDLHGSRGRTATCTQPRAWSVCR